MGGSGAGFRLTLKNMRLVSRMIMKPLLFSKSLALALAILLPWSTGFGATARELIKEGDTYDQKFNPTKALEYYLPAEQLDQNNTELLLRIARQFRHLSADTDSSKEKLRYAQLGLDYAKRAVTVSPQSSEANLSVAISYAKSAELYGNKEKIAASRQIKAFAERAVALDPRNDLAWYTLGRWHQKVAEISGFKRRVSSIAYGKLPDASNEESIECFRKAIDLSPGRSVYHVDMGITLAAMNNQKDARKFIEKGLSLPSIGKDDGSTKWRGKETLKAL